MFFVSHRFFNCTNLLSLCKIHRLDVRDSRSGGSGVAVTGGAISGGSFMCI